MSDPYAWMKNPKYRYTLHSNGGRLVVADEGYSGRFEPGVWMGNAAADSPYDAALQHLETKERPACIREVIPLDYDGKQWLWMIDYYWKEQE